MSDNRGVYASTLYNALARPTSSSSLHHPHTRPIPPPPLLPSSSLVVRVHTGLTHTILSRHAQQTLARWLTGSLYRRSRRMAVSRVSNFDSGGTTRSRAPRPRVGAYMPPLCIHMTLLTRERVLLCSGVLQVHALPPWCIPVRSLTSALFRL